jgi:DNA-directed RNA polymerases I, II, and III subunit RPABC2
MADSEENKLNIFLSSTIRTSKGTTKVIPNTAQNMYLNNTNVVSKPKTKNPTHNLIQNGGTVKSTKPSSKQTKPTDSENYDNSDSDPESSESDDESNSESDDVSTVNSEEENDLDEELEDEDESKEEEEEISSDAEKSEEEEEEENETVADTEYNEEGANEKDTEMNNEDGDDCLYQYDDLVEERESEHQSYEIPRDQRTTDPQLTHYEKVRLLGVRSKQISMGSKVMVKYDNTMGAVELAKHELINKTTPLLIKRPLPDNSYEIWKVSELNIEDENEDNIKQELESSYKKNNYNIVKNFN